MCVNSIGVCVLAVVVLAGCGSNEKETGSDSDASVAADAQTPDGNDLDLDGGEPPVDGDVGLYQVYEITISQDQSLYVNPWEEVSVRGTFTSPSQDTISVDGFYYDNDTWKLRFAPSELGVYSLHYELTDSSGVVQSVDDTFKVGASSERGFIRQHASNPYRFVYQEDGGLFSGQGMGSCVRDPVSTSFPTAWENKGWCIDKYLATDTDTACFKTADEYLDVFIGETGVGLFRWSVANCAFPLWEELGSTQNGGQGVPNNRYSVTWGQWGDRFVRQLRSRGTRIYMDPVGFGWQRPQWGSNCGVNADQDCTANVCGAQGNRKCATHNVAAINTNDLPSLKRYYRYIVARYGAFVDFFELINEYPLPDTALTELSDYIRSIDPYGHMITTNWARPDHASMELHSPHIFFNSNSQTSDLELVASAVNGNVGGTSFPARSVHGKPTIVGESGEAFGDQSGDANYEIRTRIGNRIKLWAAFFNEVSLVPWESSLSSAKWLGGVVFFSPEFRTAYAAHNRFTESMSPDILPQAMQSYANGGQVVRVYRLRSSEELYLYLVHPVSDPTNPVQSGALAFDIDAPIPGTIEWYSTADGTIVASETVVAGSNTVNVPSFTFDLAMRLR